MISPSLVEEAIAHYESKFLSLYLEKQKLERPSIWLQFFTTPDYGKEKVEKIRQELKSLQVTIRRLNLNKSCGYQLRKH